MNVDELTTNFLTSIQSKVSSAIYSTWFKDIQVLDTDNPITLYINSDRKRQHILNCPDYIDLIEQCLKDITNKDYSFELVTDFNINDEDENETTPIINNKDNSIENYDIKYKNLNSNLKPEYRFDNFIVGDSNRMAHTAALEVAKHPGKTYNPFFIYGRSGIGKTHLMHAIGNYIVENSNKTVLYVTSGQFIEDFTEMTRKHNNSDNIPLIEHFKEKYRNIDVLIIDDIQMLQNAEKTKDEFFQTYDYLKNNDKQIILSSDTTPNDLNMFESRLQTRFNWGVSIDIKPPEQELKIKILKNKILGMEIANLVKEEVYEYIATNSPSDVRSLEGALNRLLVYTSLLLPEEIDLKFAEEALIDFFGSKQYMTNDLAKIRKIVAEYYDVTEESLKSKKRTANINKARQVAMYIAKITTNETIERIGQEFGRDHATVLHGCDKVEKEMKTNDELNREIMEIKDKCVN